MRGQTRSSAKARLWAPAAAGGVKQQQVGQAGFSYRVMVGAGRGLSPEEWLRGLPAPLGVLSAGGMLRSLLLLLALRKWQVGSSLMAQHVQDPAWSLLWYRFDPWPANCLPRGWPPKKVALGFLIIIYLFFFCLCRAAPKAYGSFWARG